MIKTMKYLLSLLLLLNCQQLMAENWYRVELIVFENLYPISDGERWDKYPGLPDTENSVKLLEADQEDSQTAFQTLDKSKLTLTGSYSTLRKSSQYRPLGYLGWQQPALEASEAQSVHVNMVNENNESIVLGNINIRSSLYLHVDLDLAYSINGESLADLEELGPVIVEEDSNFVTRLTETRRIKLNDIHYFDHPLFGAIVRVVRLNSE